MLLQAPCVRVGKLLHFSVLFSSLENKTKLFILLPSVLLHQLHRWQMAACHHGLGWSPNQLGVSGCSGTAWQSR